MRTQVRQPTHFSASTWAIAPPAVREGRERRRAARAAGARAWGTVSAHVFGGGGAAGGGGAGAGGGAGRGGGGAGGSPPRGLVSPGEGSAPFRPPRPVAAP